MGIGRNVIIAGIIAVAAVVGALLAATYFTSSSTSLQQSTTQQVMKQELSIKLVDVLVKSVDDKKALLEISFSIVNPTNSTLILEAINYTLYADNVRIGESIIGERLEGIVTVTGKTQYLLPNNPLILKDTMQINRSRAVEGIWDKLASNSIVWSVDGKYSVTGWQEKEFKSSMQ
jgi:LEA14-like dessication related protein